MGAGAGVATRKNLRGHDRRDPRAHVQDGAVRGARAVPVRQGVRPPVPVRAADVLDADDRLVVRLHLRAGRHPVGELPLAVRRAGPPGRPLRAARRPRVRAVRLRAGRRGRRGHGDLRRPRRAQGARGARRAAGARRRPGQEPGRAALPRAGARDVDVQHLRADLRDRRRHPRHHHQRRAAGPVLGDVLQQRQHRRAGRVAHQDRHLRRGDRDRLLLQGPDGERRRRGRRPRGQPGGGDLVHGDRGHQLRLHPDAAGAEPDPLGAEVTLPPSLRAWLLSVGDMLEFWGRIMGRVYDARVFRFFGESLRQAGILIAGSLAIILGLVFVLGLQCGLEGAYGARTVGAPGASGAITALCNLREVTPYAFGYMMAAKVSTGFVAELGSMRITDETDALEVMGLDSVLYLCAPRLLGMWMVLPFVYISAVTVGFFGSFLAVVLQIGEVSVGGYFQLFWQFQNPIDLLYSLIKGMCMSTFVVLVGLYYGYFASGGAVGGGGATPKALSANIGGTHVIGLLTPQIFWGGKPRAPIGG